MKIASYFLLAFVMVSPKLVFSQATGNVTMAMFAGVPTGTCNSSARVLALNTVTGDLYSCRNGFWGIISSGALPPSAPGDTLFGNNSVSTGTPLFFIPGGDLSFSSGNFSVNSVHFGPNLLSLVNTGISSGNCLQVSGSTIIGGPCGTGGGGSGTVTSVSSSSEPTWLSLTTTNPTTTPHIALNQNTVPANTVLANATSAAAIPTWVAISSIGGGGGSGLNGCSTPSAGVFTCDTSVAAGTGTQGVITFAHSTLPAPPSTALGALATDNSGVWWSPGNNAAFTRLAFVSELGTGGGGGSGTVTSVSTSSGTPLATLSVTNPTTAPAISFNWNATTAGNQLFGNTSSAAANPTYFSPSGDISMSGSAFSVNALHFGSSVFTLANSAVVTGNCLQFSGSQIVGGACGTGGTGGGSVTSVSSSSDASWLSLTTTNSTTTPHMTLNTNNVSAGDVAISGGNFSVNSLHFGSTVMSLGTTGISTGNCLQFSSSTIIGGTCGSTGGTTLNGCSTPSSGNFTCDNSVQAGAAGAAGYLRLGAAALPSPPSTAVSQLAADSSGLPYWSPGSGGPFTRLMRDVDYSPPGGVVIVQ